MEILKAILPYLIGASMLAVLLSLFGGLAAMSRGGGVHARRGNRFMRWRVASQGVALALLVLYFVVMRFG